MQKKFLPACSGERGRVLLILIKEIIDYKVSFICQQSNKLVISIFFKWAKSRINKTKRLRKSRRINHIKLWGRSWGKRECNKKLIWRRRKRKENSSIQKTRKSNSSPRILIPLPMKSSNRPRNSSNTRKFRSTFKSL